MSVPFAYETDPFDDPPASPKGGAVESASHNPSFSSVGLKGAATTPRQGLALAEALWSAGYRESAIANAKFDGSLNALACIDAWSDLPAADAALASQIGHSGVLVVPSVQLARDGRPRFLVTGHDAEELAIACRLEHGPHGIQAELRTFLDDALCVGDVFLDMVPALGFAALGAATSGQDVSVVTAFDDSRPADRLFASARLSACGERVVIAATAELDSVASSLIKDAGLVTLHVGDAGDVVLRMAAVRGLHRSDRIGAVAWRCGPSDGEMVGVATAAAELEALGFSHFALAWRDGRSELVPAYVAASNEYVFSISRAMIARSEH